MMRMGLGLARVCVIIFVAGPGCHAESEPAPTTPACLPPNRVVADRCLEPGVQDNGCPAGTLGLEDGSCQPAGVPPELCAEGFEPDGNMGCEPILPDEPCRVGQMAVPGESACHSVMPCGAGKWGDIPVDATTVYVDRSYPGADSDGSAAKPWTTISEGVAAATFGALIAVAAGSYVEDVLVAKRVRLWGVCPDEVELAGTIGELAALDLRPGATGTEVRGLAITGDNIGVLIAGVADVLVEQLWVHEALGRGVDIENALGPTPVTLRSSLIEQNHGSGVFVSGSDATLDGLVVRGTLPRASDQRSGRGISIQPSPDTGAATALVRTSLVDQNHEAGVYISGSDATLDGVVVRGTLPRPSDQAYGRGLHIEDNLATGAPASALVRSSLVERNHATGVFVGASDATLEGVLVRDTLPRASDQHFGLGIGIQVDPATGAPATAVVRGSLVEHNHFMGIYVDGAHATLDALLVRNTLPRASDGFFGDGVAVASGTLPGVPVTASGVVTSTRIEQSARAGLANFGAHVALADSALSCNAFDLDGEKFVDLPFTFENLGDNGCGCPEPTGACVAQSSGLAPPEPLTATP